MPDLAVTALGADRPGIVATIAEVLASHASNVTEATMTRLAGHVAVVLHVTTSDAPEDLQEALGVATEPLGIRVSVAPAISRDAAPLATHLLSVYGPDQPGLLADVTRAVADSGATIIDLASQLVAGDQPATWAMSAEVVAPRDPDRLGADLDATCTRLGLEHTLQELDHG